MNNSIKLTKNGRIKDTRKVFDGEKLFVEGSFVGTFDGKFNPETNTLKIYKYYGDITKLGEAIQDYAYNNKIDTIIVNFTF